MDHGEAGLVRQLKLKQEGGQVAGGEGVEVQAGVGQEQQEVRVERPHSGLL